MTHTIVSLLPRFLPDDHYDGFRKLADFYFFNELTDEERHASRKKRTFCLSRRRCLLTKVP